MSGFLEDPSVLTKEKLKSELLANNVALPSGDHRKDVYVQLYLKTLTLQNKEMSQATDTFSSDEDLPPVVVNNSSRSGKKAKRKTDKPQPDDVSVADLPDQGLKDQLEKYGVNAGPVVASTRKLYEKKLQKLLEQGSPTAPPEAPAVVSSRQNGNADSDQYSDKEDAEEGVEPGLQSAPEAEAEPLPVVNRPAGSRGKPPVQSKTSNHQDHNQVVEMVTPGDETPSTNGEDVLKDMSPTGMSATCRRPIRGAAGRPVKESDFWLNESLLQRRNLTESSAFYAESGAGQLSYASAPSGGGKRELRFLPVWLQLLLLSVVAGFLIFIFIMETDKLSPSDQSLSP